MAWLVAILVSAGCTDVDQPIDDTPPAAPDAPVGAVTVALAEGGPGMPTTAIDARDGTTYFAWAGKEGEATNVYFSRLAAGAAEPSAPIRVNDVVGEVTVHAQAPTQVAVGPDGTVYVAWIKAWKAEGRRFRANEVRLARSTDGGATFSPAITASDDPGFPSSFHFHDLAVGPDGAVFLSWLDEREIDRAERRQRGELSQSAPASPFRLASHGNALLHRPGAEVRVARSTDQGQTFAASVKVASNTCECCRTALAVGPENDVYVAWRHIFPGSERDIALARSTDGGASFSRPVRIHDDGWKIEGCPHTGPSLATDSTGTLHIAWYSGAQDFRGAFYSTSADGGATFAVPDTLVAGGPIAQVSLTSDGENSVLVAWEDKAESVLRVARTDAGRLTPVGVAPFTDGLVPALAATPTQWSVAWYDGATSRAHVEK